MFNYKTWKLYYPGTGTFPPTPVVDENGNSITPDSLKKNMTIPAEAPGNDLEKVLSNINGTDPAYPVEGTSGLIKQMNELAKNPPSGGVFTVHAGVAKTGIILDKRMGEIQEAWARGDKIDIIVKNVMHTAPVILYDVHYDTNTNMYTGSVIALNESGSSISYLVNRATEADALNAYPADVS